jgi:hypothetical protein
VSYGRTDAKEMGAYGALVAAENRLLASSEVLYGFFRVCLRDGTFDKEDLSEPETEFLAAMRDFRKKRAAHQRVQKGRHG